MNEKKELPEYVSLNDAVSLLLNITYRTGITDVMQTLWEYDREYEENLSRAESESEKNKYRAYMEMYLTWETLVKALFNVLQKEIQDIREGKDSILELEDKILSTERILTVSLLEWATQKGFDICGWEPPRHWRQKPERSYSSEYLDIIDDVIATFCEKSGEHFTDGKEPKNEAIISYVTEKYGQLSEKILTSIPTIVRQGVTFSTKKK